MYEKYLKSLSCKLLTDGDILTLNLTKFWVTTGIKMEWTIGLLKRYGYPDEIF